MFVLGARPVR